MSEKAITISKRADGVAVVSMDVPGETMNTLKQSFGDEFAAVFDALDKDTAVKAVVFTSGKPDSFIAGADVKMIERVRAAADAEEMSRSGQAAMDHLEKFRVPVVAAIHGPCLGGGLEVALACAGRVASDDRKTKLGLPESQLGLLPAAGGTQRLPRLVGVQASLDMMLTGKQIGAKKAKKMGLVDEVCPKEVLVEAAAKLALSLCSSPRARGPSGRAAVTEALLAKNALGRKVVFDQARKALHEKTRGNYPAQDAILDVVKIGLAKGFAAGLDAEARAFGKLVVSPESAALRSIFFATVAMKKDKGTDDPKAEARKVQKVAMLGAGLMGAGIAYITASQARTPVRLKDKDDAGLLKGMAYVREIVDKRVARKSIDALERDQIMTRVSPTTSYDGFADVDVVIEAVFEDLALKHRMVKDVEAAGKKDVIFASNTSSLPITKIAEASAHPETVIGMHYFSPVHKMPLLEIIVQERTAPWVTATCVELGKKQGKTVIVVRDGVGFYTTRILGPFMNEAAWILGEGVRVDAIDEALMDFGYPVGPMTLLDEVGIDIAEKVGHIVQAAFGDRIQAPAGFEKLIADGRQGRKNGKGFYVYDTHGKSKKKPVDESVYSVLGITPGTKMAKEEIAERCCLQMVNEAARCFGEGILRSARDGDIGAIFGIGFPPFRGGPFRYVDTLGVATVVAKLRNYEKKHGKRFEPAPVLVEMAEHGLTFHGPNAAVPGMKVEAKREVRTTA